MNIEFKLASCLNFDLTLTDFSVLDQSLKSHCYKKMSQTFNSSTDSSVLIKGSWGNTNTAEGMSSGIDVT